VSARARMALALAAVAAALLAAPALAGAHATLQSSTPARGATLARSPATLSFHFDEAVEGNLGAVRVYDAAGRRVDRGDAFHPGGRGPDIAVHLEPDLAHGTYTATYRVISADGHVVSAGTVFSVGHAAGGGRSVEQLLRDSGSGPVTSTAFSVARALQYAALGVAGGALVFLLVAWGPAWRAARTGSERGRAAADAVERRARTLLLGAAVAGTASALAAVVLEAAEAAGLSGWSALRPDPLGEVVGTRFGTLSTVAAGCWLLVGALTLAAVGRRPGGRRLPAWLPLVPIGYLIAVPGLSGHAATQSPVGVLLPANVLHVAAMTAWVGGLVALLVLVPAATRRLEPAERTPPLAGALARFSTIALGAVAVLLVTGLVQAFFEIRHLDRVLSTAFGRAVLIKAVLLALLIGLGAVNRRRTVPRLRAAAASRRSPGAEGVVLRRTLRAEVVLLAAVLAVTGALAGYAPATTVASGPFSTTTRVGPQELQLTVDPARVGANELHLYLTDPRTGAQLDTAKEVHVAAELPSKGIGRIEAHAAQAGPGHYVVPDLTLGVAGRWRLTVTVRVSEFDEYAKKIEVEVR
jgi:copper transport protein